MTLNNTKSWIVSLLLIFVCNSVFSQAPSNTYWWNENVFYEVFVRSFKDSDGDGKGDIKGLIQKLDYLNDGNPNTTADLGVTGLWLMPIQQSPSYHGYDVTDYRTVEQDYGTNDDFKTLMAEAHKRGIKVIVDYVMNHTSSQHPWFQSSLSPSSDKRNWYRWQATNPGTTAPWNGTQQVWHSKNGNYYYGIFWSEMPDLNYSTKAVKDEMFDIARFWLQDMKVDGFRLDAVKYIFEDGNVIEDVPETFNFFKDFRTYYKSVNPEAFAVGEAWTSTAKVAPYVNDKGLDYCFEFDLAASIINSLKAGNASPLQTQIDNVIKTYPYLQYGTFITNHDLDRTINQLGGNMERAKVAADLLLTLPGVPYIYYGDELAMYGGGADENKRTPMLWNNTSQAGFTTGTPWRIVNNDYTTNNVESMKYDPSSIWNRYKKFIALRNNYAALRKGNYKAITSSSAAILSFLRNYQNENIIVVSNLSQNELSSNKLSLGSGITPGTYTMVELLGGKSISVVIDQSGGFTNLTIDKIPARKTLVYKLMPPASVASKVTFEIDMRALIASSDFKVATESVDIVADFNGFGSAVTKLTDDDADGIYSVSVASLNIGSKINYKYRINAVNDGRTEFSNSIYYRELIVAEGMDTITDTYQKSVSTGIANPLSTSFNSVYPSPANKEFFIEYSGEVNGIVNYRITDLLGIERIVSSFASSEKGIQSIPCDELISGIYMITLEHNGSKKTCKIVVQK